MKRLDCIIIVVIILAFRPLLCESQTEIFSIQSDTTLAGKYIIKGEDFFRNTQYDSSLHYFKNASELYKKWLDHTDDLTLWGKYIHCLSYIGKNFTRQLKFEAASEYLHRALDLCLEKLGENNIFIKSVYNGLATLFYRQSDLEKALEYHKKFLEVCKLIFGLTHKDIAIGYYNLALTYRDMGDYDAALSSFKKSRDVYQQLDQKNNESIASAYYGMGYTYMLKGYYDLAFKNLTKALTIRLELLGEKHRLVFESYYAMGRFYKETGDLDKAIEYYKKSITICSEIFGTQHYGIAYGYNNIGVIYYRKGNIPEALQYYNKALSSKIQIFGESHPSVANTYANMGRVYFSQGKYEKAFEQFNKSLLIRFETLGRDHPSVAVDYMNMGRIYNEMSDYNQALDYFNKALSIQLNLTGRDHPQIGQIYNSFGEVYLKRNDYQEAITFFQKALISLAPEFNEPDIYQNPLIDNNLSDQDLLNALHYKAESFHKLYFDKSQNREDLQMSLNTYKRASDLIDDMRSGYKAEGSMLFLGENVIEIYDKAIQTAIELYTLTNDPFYKEEAFQFAEKSKFSTLALHLQESRAKQFAGIPDTLLQRENMIKADLAFYNTQLQKELQKKEKGDSTKIQSYENKLFDLNSQYQELVKAFEVQYPKYYDLKYQTQTTSVADLQKLLDNQSVLVEYFIGENVINVFTVTRNDMDVFQIVKESSFSDLAGTLNRTIKKIDVQGFLPASVELYKKLIDPVQTKINGKNKLIIIPHGILSKIPFEILITNMSDVSNKIDFAELNYMIRFYDITYNYSATLYAKRSAGKKEGSALNDFAGFAPVFSDEADNNLIPADRFALTDLDYSESDYRAVRVDGKRFNELKYSEKEIQEIVQHFKKNKKTAKGYYRKEASENNFKATAGNYRYIHIASHGIVNEEYPQLSGIIFSQSQDPTNQEDGILYAGEIYNLHLNADLVVLSSCESGIGKLVRGEGLMALTRGFIYAGADNLIVSLWKVSDKHTSELMTELYKHILNGNSHSEALRKAKLHMLQNPKTAFPKSWASFVLIGE